MTAWLGSGAVRRPRRLRSRISDDRRTALTALTEDFATATHSAKIADLIAGFVETHVTERHRG
jgi:hypothetical protein